MIKKIKFFLVFIFSKKMIIGLSFFFVWILFLDENNFFQVMKISKKIKNLKKELYSYEDKIESLNKKNKILNGNDEEFEKFAREKYFMKKKDEIVFVIEE